MRHDPTQFEGETYRCDDCAIDFKSDQISDWKCDHCSNLISIRAKPNGSDEIILNRILIEKLLEGAYVLIAGLSVNCVYKVLSKRRSKKGFFVSLEGHGSQEIKSGHYVNCIP